MDNRCNPKGKCVHCHVEKAQLPDKGFCASCEKKGVPGSPKNFYEKCDSCGKYHVDAAPPPSSWSDYF